jgi:hemin uptake protein HemP
MVTPERPKPPSGASPAHAGPARTPPHSAPAEARPTAPRRWRSADLFGAAQEIEIEHGQAVYRLRVTSLDKLILTK